MPHRTCFCLYTGLIPIVYKTKFTMPKTVLVVWLIFVYSTEASRILGVFPVPQYSHYTLGNRLMVALAEKGHDVTIITPFKEKNPPKFYREIFLEGAVEEDQGQCLTFAACCEIIFMLYITTKNNDFDL